MHYSSNVHLGTRSNEVNQFVRSPANMQELGSTRTGELFLCIFCIMLYLSAAAAF